VGRRSNDSRALPSCDSFNLLLIPDKNLQAAHSKKDHGIILWFLEDTTLTLSVKKIATRSGTRIPCAIPVTLNSLDPVHPFSEACEIILVNLRGCAARSNRAVGIGTAVELCGLPKRSKVTGRTVNCISLGQRENIWLLGVELDEPGNVWSIEAPPADWFSAP
jgi:hypothetical protein